MKGGRKEGGKLGGRKEGTWFLFYFYFLSSFPILFCSKPNFLKFLSLRVFSHAY
jgi:hypothetical protein